MASRVFKVVPDGKKYRIHVRTSYDKRGKISLKEYRKYPTENAAQNDVKRLRAHFDDGKSSVTFKQEFHSQWNCKNAGEAKCYRASISSVRGIVGKRLVRKQNREYSRYRKLMQSANMEACSRAEWDRKASKDGAAMDRLLRKFARDPSILHASILRGILSAEETILFESITCSIDYFKERLLVLRKFSSDNSKSLLILRKAIYSGEPFSLLLKAKFEDERKDKDIIDLTSDDTFTMTNITKAQLIKCTLQCTVVEKVYALIREKIGEETKLLDSILSEVESVRSNLSLAKQKVKEHWDRIKEFKIQNSMVVMTAKVSSLTGDIVKAATISKWCAEFREHGMFKEDLRGCYQRRFFLEEHGLRRQFELYLKNERSLTVDAARRNLEQIIEISILKSESCIIDAQSLLPLNNRTVHRWMLQCNCKYEKATTSYYTDSHEAEETKKDFRDR